MGGYQSDAGTVQQESGFGFVDRFWTESFVDGLVAKAGGGQSSATKLTSMFNRVATVATAADSVKLPPIGAGDKNGLSVAVMNDSTNPLQIFGDNTDTVNAVASGTGVSQMGKSVVWYTATQTGKWIAQGLGSGYSGSNQTYSYADGLTALASGGQTGATPITTSMARFTTVASAGDSSLLMAAAAGLSITVINAGAAIMNVFPAGTDQINGLGASNAYAVPVGGVVDFFCTLAGQWHTLSSFLGGAQQTYAAAANTTNFTATGAQISGGSVSALLDLTGTLGSSQALTLPTVAALVAAMTVAGLNPQAGLTYELEICYRNGTNTWTVTTNTGWTLTNTMTITGAGVTRRFIVSLQSLTAATLTSIGTVTLGAK